MVPGLICAPDFFGLQEIWAPRSLGPKKFGPEEISQVSNANPLLTWHIKRLLPRCAHLMRVAQYTFHTDWSKKDNFVLYFKGFQKRLGYNQLHKYK
jgi:hypothetical protein